MTSRITAGIASFLLFVSPSYAVDVDRPDVKAFIKMMVKEHDYDRDKLRDILGQAEMKRSIIDQISKPAEKTLTWAEYRPIFMTKRRVRAGAAFWRENRDTLEDISARNGVSIEILVGIIGVETYFGRITGGHRVLDALSTLAFFYPPRAKFFRGELEQFLLLVREEEMLATDAFGSYAGAMGRPQFMPSSYRAYAIDSTGDGKRDIWNDWADVAASIANYFNAHGWKSGEEVAARATLSARWSGVLPKNKLKAEETVSSLSEMGVTFSTTLPNEAPGQLLTLQGAEGNELWVGFHNFFVITRYNHSVMYALAVHQLGQEIALEVHRGDP
ncbi:MAG: lytic murein transglycosylase B [Gammaproteobacteria bacterium]|nr:lytic murein transglycosylase B [Gammaproteobacteria bacterium]MDH3750453.1 lytic murein transglycosylase B [Gammaproteobacteria bacterium]MDH3805801.1 lytic murein transglycosylase B [Gammaproteobacteria bacterium]